MGLFGSKDKVQDQNLADLSKRLDATITSLNILIKNQDVLTANQNVLIKNNQYFITKDKQIDQSLDVLHKTDASHDATDQKLQKLFDALSQIKTETEATQP